ncbi:MAG: hypothetical protein WDM78_17265 [Puia sp.]
MVAIFTQHDPVGEKAGASSFQNQSIAYSLDDGFPLEEIYRQSGSKNTRIKRLQGSESELVSQTEKMDYGIGGPVTAIMFYSP